MGMKRKPNITFFNYSGFFVFTSRKSHIVLFSRQTCLNGWMINQGRWRASQLKRTRSLFCSWFPKKKKKMLGSFISKFCLRDARQIDSCRLQLRYDSRELWRLSGDEKRKDWISENDRYVNMPKLVKMKKWGLNNMGEMCVFEKKVTDWFLGLEIIMGLKDAVRG